MERNWFSNFIPYKKPIIYQNIIYQTPEHLYQALKTNNVQERQYIASMATPGQAKRAGKKVTLRVDWENYKITAMCIALNFRKRDPGWIHKLVNTQGEIVEWNTWHDRIWGKCICPRCNKQGRNLLGKILMQMREQAN
jgi:ribA/ribD-fused uncharacterized protein